LGQLHLPHCQGTQNHTKIQGMWPSNVTPDVQIVPTTRSQEISNCQIKLSSE
jgi:hypothetical protein